MAKLLTPRRGRYIAGISAILLGAANITSPVNLKDMLPDFFSNPLLGNISIIGIAAYGALLGGVLVLLKRTE